MPFDDLAAILLVGGRSSRMGRPKAWLDLDGRPLLAHMVDGVRRWTDEIVLVAAPDQVLPVLAMPAAPRVVRDLLPGQGPLAALALGLAAARAPWALVLGCDAPLVRGAVIERLLAARAPGCDAVVPEWDDRPQPLVALYRTALAPAVADLVAAGERRAHVLAGRPGARRVPAAVLRPLDPEGESFRAVNTPEEFAAAAARWRARRDHAG
ncbi:MAG: molybdenum cofactor guanylyltransferase [Deltaproteobacteria bacterium]|nr:molybdenum cofactor guanylyltransferase [Deltaproteobacteria bacterium]